MKALIVLSLMITACGAEQEPTSATAPAAQAREVANPAETTAQRVEAPQGASQAVSSPTAAPAHSLYVADASMLPACDAEAEGWLIYVKADSELQACVSGSWMVVDIRGAKGAAGAQGATGAKGDQGSPGVNGAKGADGATGATGAQGVQGEQGLGAIPGAGLVWNDPDAKNGITQWVIVAKNIIYQSGSCPTGFLVPNYTEQLPAKFHAYFASFEATLPAGAKYWTSTLGRYAITLNGDTTAVETDPNATHLYICHN